MHRAVQHPLHRVPVYLVPYTGRDALPPRCLIDFQSNGLGAISLGAVYRDNFEELDAAILVQPVLMEGFFSSKARLHVHFRGYSEYMQQIWVRNRLTRSSVTMKKLLRTMAQAIEIAIKRAETQQCSDPTLAFSPGVITIENFILTGILSVSKASIQPVLEFMY